MDTHSAADILPDKSKRNPVIYVVVHPGKDGMMEITECATRTDVKRFVENELGNPDLVQKIYRVSATIELKKRTVVSF